MNKGVQYSHYCGTELLEIVSAIRLLMELVDEDREESIKWGQYALDMTNKLRIKISDLDVLNEMKY